MHPLLKNKPTVKRAVDVPMNSTARIGGSKYFVCNDEGTLLLFSEDNVEPTVIMQGEENGWWVNSNYIPTNAYLSSVLNGLPPKHQLGTLDSTVEVTAKSRHKELYLIQALDRTFLYNKAENDLIEIRNFDNIGVISLSNVLANDPIWDLVE